MQFVLSLTDYIPGSHELRPLILGISSTVSDKPSHCLVHMSVQELEPRHIPHAQSEINKTKLPQFQ